MEILATLAADLDGEALVIVTDGPHSGKFGMLADLWLQQFPPGSASGMGAAPVERPVAPDPLFIDPVTQVWVLAWNSL
jgi:hypothetical protein